MTPATQRTLSRIRPRLSDLYDALMTKEIGDDGWDLRDELLELRSIVLLLAECVETLASNPSPAPSGKE